MATPEFLAEEIVVNFGAVNPEAYTQSYEVVPGQPHVVRLVDTDTPPKTFYITVTQAAE